MPYDIIVLNRKNHIRVEIEGARTSGKETADAISVWTRVAETCRSLSINRVLVILQLTGNIPIMTAYDIGSTSESFGWSREFKLALVDLNDESRKVNMFGETVAVNRGFRVMVFDNEHDAKEWLLGV